MEASAKPILGTDQPRELEIQKRRLRENCREFESVMVSYLMKTMREGVIRAEEPESGRDMYEEMLAVQMAKEIGRSNALGIGAILYAKLEPLVKAPSAQTSSQGGPEAQPEIPSPEDAERPGAAPSEGADRTPFIALKKRETPADK